MPKTAITLSSGEECTVSYFKRGNLRRNKEPMVILHGLGSSGKVLHRALASKIMKEAKTSGRKLQIFTLDMPGHGDSEKDLVEFSTDITVEVLYKFIDKLDLGPVHLYGESLGGSTAIKFAARYPQMVKTLTLQGPPINGRDWGRIIQSVHRPVLASRHLLRKARLGRLNIFSKLSPDTVSKLMHKLNPNTDLGALQKAFARDPGLEKIIIDALRALPHAALMDYAYDVVNMNLRGELIKISETEIPVFLVDGETPERKGVDTLERIKETIPRCKTLIIEGEGHLASIISGEDIARHFLDFIENVSSR